MHYAHQAVATRMTDQGSDSEPSVTPSTAEGRLGPPRYKMAIVIWLALYPAVAVALSALRPLIGDLPAPLQALVLTLIVIPLAVWILIPFVQGRLQSWLER